MPGYGVSSLTTFSNADSSPFLSLSFSVQVLLLLVSHRQETMRAVIVGAGPAGCVMSHYLLEQGFHVQLFERHAPHWDFLWDSEADKAEILLSSDDRSYPIVISSRAITAIEGTGMQLPPTLLKQLVGNCAHLPKGKKLRRDYLHKKGFQSYAVTRNTLTSFLQQSLFQRNSDNIALNFGWELVELTKDKTACILRNNETGEEKEIRFDILIGADGVSSKVRCELIRLDSCENMPSPLVMELTKNPSVYKTFSICPSLARDSPLFLDHDRVQVWPKLRMLLVNAADGRFWGAVMDQKLVLSTSASEIESQFKVNAPQVYELLVKENPNFSEDFLKQTPKTSGAAVILSRFHEGNILLIGDAAHAMFPSLGTGCNAALEDCKLFNHILTTMSNSGLKKETIPMATAEFTKMRLADAHAIVKMNLTRNSFIRTLFVMCQSLFYQKLQDWFPNLVGLTAYQLLQTEVPYSKIKQKKKLEDMIFYCFLATSFLILTWIAAILVKRVALAR